MKRLLLLIATVGCTSSAAAPAPKPTTASYTFDPTCAKVDTTTPGGHADDVDGDGTPDWIITNYDTVDVYVKRGDCLSLVTTIRARTKVAFAHVVANAGPPGVRDLAIETWLFHGDRTRSIWTWTGHGYSPSGRSEEILGPRR